MCICMSFLWTYHYGIFFVVVCVLLRGSGTSGGIVGMVGDGYCMWVEYRVVWYVRVFALRPLPLSFKVHYLLYTSTYVRPRAYH